MLSDLYDNYAGHTVGTSGAIDEVLVAFGVLYTNAKLALMFIPAPVPAKYFISGVTDFSLFGGNIAHYAHLGGVLIGFLLLLLLRKVGRDMRDERNRNFSKSLSH